MHIQELRMFEEMLDRKITSIFGWVLALTLLTLIAMPLLWWRLVRPSPRVRIPVSLRVWSRDSRCGRTFISEVIASSV
jgi:hypothetical protein